MIKTQQTSMIAALVLASLSSYATELKDTCPTCTILRANPCAVFRELSARGSADYGEKLGFGGTLTSESVNRLSRTMPDLRINQVACSEGISHSEAAQKLEMADSLEREASDKAEKKADEKRIASLSGVRIGMTREQVRNKTTWGSPDEVNTTTTARGTHEQWVYRSGDYLYFDNGKLTAIQN